MTILYVFRGKSIPGLSWHWLYATNIYIQFHVPFEQAHSWAQALGTWAHFWSLAIEEQFYLIFAPVILLLPSKRAIWTCGAILILGLIWRIALFRSGMPDFVIFVDTLANFALLAAGGIFGLMRGRMPALPAYAAWVLLFVVLAMPFVFVGLDQPVKPVLFAPVAILLLMSVVNSQESALVKALSIRPIAYFGRISYGFYLYQSYPPVTYAPISSMGANFDWLHPIIAFSLALIVSIISYHCLEMPAQNWGRRKWDHMKK